MTRLDLLPGLTARNFVPHRLHGQDSVWPEKNCYVDIWLELLPALGLDPLPLLAFALAVDFEGDQWTFFKPPHNELRTLYGVDVQELTLWRPLLLHAQEHMQAGKFICCEVDAFDLPDTAGTDYRQQHSKTSILLVSLDVEARQLGYFHNAGFFELAGEDFDRLFHLNPPPAPAALPLFAELVRVDGLLRRPPDELAAMSLHLLREHWARRPRSNPFPRFAQRLAHDLPALQAAGLAHYHAWAFASIRQAGAAFELAGEHLRWQSGRGHPELLEAAACFERISQANKSLILKGARAVHAGRPLDAAALLAQMGDDWARGMAVLQTALA
jgi:hypothetical protein